MSIKSKIIFVTFSLLFVLGLVIISVSLFAFYRDRELIIAGNDASITAFEGQINTEIAALEKNVLDLSLMGEIYYQQGKVKQVGEFFTKQILQNYPHSMGNGIYFLPYKIDENQKISCIHAVWNHGRTIGMLPSCDNSTFDYFKQNWYAEIKKDLENGKLISWTRPYKSTQLDILMTTVGAGIYNNNNLVGMATIDWELDTILKSIFKIKPTPKSFVLFADKTNDYIIATTEPGVDNSSIMGKSLKTLKWYSDELKERTPFKYKGVKYIPYVKRLNNAMILIVNVPLFELFANALHHLCILFSILLVVTIFIVSVLYQTLKRNINKPIDILTDIAQKISDGDLDRTIYIDKPSELAKLANAFNKMKTDIKTHLTELAKISSEKEKIESELALAKNIQDSALPKDFPKDAYFELVASMTPAREVGGDFYDFFAIDENRWGLVMADVCGKGITAALYMMSAKTTIKNMLQAGYPLKEAVIKANNSLYAGSAPLMFVTTFIGIFDLRTGKIEYVNAGHCPPLKKTKDGYVYVDVIKNMVLGVKPNYEYKVEEITLHPNERLFLYTDGVTEAQTKENKFFGEDRLLKTLNQKELPLSKTLEHVHKSIQKFIGDAPQFDDITMLIVEFHHKK